MNKLLTPLQIEHYHQYGYVAPIRVMPVEQALLLRKHLEDFERSQGGPLKGSLRHKTHLLFTWLSDLVRQEKVLDAVEDLYGETCCVGAPISSSKKGMIRPTFPGIKTLPIGDYPSPTSSPHGSRSPKATSPTARWK